MPRTHILQMREDGKPFNDKRTFCGLNRFDNSYGYTSGPVFNNDNDYYCHFCFNGYKEKDMPEINTRANAREQLRELGTIDAESIITAVEKRVPQPHNQSRILATIASTERRKDASQVSAQDLFYTKGKSYIGRKVEIPSLGIGGEVTDIVMPTARVVVVVIGEKAATLNHDTQLYVFPENPPVVNTLEDYRARCRDGKACPAFWGDYDCMKPNHHVGYCVFEREDGVVCIVEHGDEGSRLVPANEELRRREQKMPAPVPWIGGDEPSAVIQTTLGTLYANRKQYEGYVVDFECGNVRGVVTDVYASPSDPGWYMVVVDGRIHCIGGGTGIAIEMPKRPPTKVYAKFKIADLYETRRLHLNKELKNVAEDPAIGVMTDIATGRNKHVYTVIIDGKIYNYAADAEVWVQL